MPDEDGNPLGGAQTAGLADLRGGYLSALAVTDEGVAQCLSADPALHDPVLGEETGMGAWAPADSFPEPARDGTTVLWGGGLRTAEGSYTTAFGRAGADVTGVVLTDADGRRVAATPGTAGSRPGDPRGRRARSPCGPPSPTAAALSGCCTAAITDPASTGVGGDVGRAGASSGGSQDPGGEVLPVRRHVAASGLAAENVLNCQRA